MVAFGHTAVGAAVGLSTYYILGDINPTLGLVAAGTLGVVSHYAADAIPHGHFFKSEQYKQKVKYVIVFDLFLSILIFLAAAYIPQHSIIKLLYVLFGIGGSQLPDVLDGLIYTDFLKAKGWLAIEHRFHQATHWHGSLLLSLSDIWQVLVVLLSLIYIIRFS